MDEFSWFLFTGLAIIVVFVVFFGTNIFGITLQTTSKTSYPTALELEASPIADRYTIGRYSSEEHQRYLTFIETSNKYMTDKFPLGSKNLTSGVLFNTNSLKYRIEKPDIKTMHFSFILAETNNYAPLVIKINNKVLKESRLPAGEYNIEVPSELISETMNIEIFTASSGWKLWAPSLYVLKDIVITTQSLKSKSSSFEFEIPKEIYDNFKYGKIDVRQFETAIGKLEVSLNGNIIFNNNTGNMLSFEFGKDSIKTGFNRIIFNADTGSEFKGKAEILLFFNSETKHSVKLPFNLTKKEYNNMKSGSIKFLVTKIQEPGCLSVKILSKNNTTVSEYAKLSEGWYNLDFNKNDITNGISYLTIESCDNSIFEVSDISIDILK